MHEYYMWVSNAKTVEADKTTFCKKTSTQIILFNQCRNWFISEIPINYTLFMTQYMVSPV